MEGRWRRLVGKKHKIAKCKDSLLGCYNKTNYFLKRFFFSCGCVYVQARTGVGVKALLWSAEVYLLILSSHLLDSGN